MSYIIHTHTMSFIPMMDVQSNTKQGRKLHIQRKWTDLLM